MIPLVAMKRLQFLPHHRNFLILLRDSLFLQVICPADQPCPSRRSTSSSTMSLPEPVIRCSSSDALVAPIGLTPPISTMMSPARRPAENNPNVYDDDYWEVYHLIIILFGLAFRAAFKPGKK